jgi:DNA polymerase-3 subunit epsilon
MKASNRKIAMTDLETTGDIPGLHEILEIGLVVFDTNTLKIVDTLNVKIKPLNIENAVPAALERNGYDKKDWKNAVSLEEAVKIYAKKTIDCVFCAYNATFDWGFMNDAFRKTGVQNKMDYHRLDLLSIAWTKGLADNEKWSLKTACKLFGVPPEPEPHTALNGAMTAYELFKKLK